MKTLSMTMLACAAALAAAPAAAQEIPLSFEARLDAGIPLQDADETLDAGVGFGIRAMLDLAPTFALYGGYSRMEFDVDEDVGDGDVEEEGFELGGRVGVGHGHGSGEPYFLLGALFHEDDTGLEAGLGADYAVSWNVSVTPEVRFRTVADVDYLTLGMGVRFRF